MRVVTSEQSAWGAVPTWDMGRIGQLSLMVQFPCLGGVHSPAQFPGKTPQDHGDPKGMLTGNSVADLDEDFLKIGEVIPRRLEHVHEAVDEQILYPVGQEMALSLMPAPVSPPAPSHCGLQGL